MLPPPTIITRLLGLSMRRISLSTRRMLSAAAMKKISSPSSITVSPLGISGRSLRKIAATRVSTGLLANNVTSIQAIINGTTNYSLTKMARDDVDLPQALAEAQTLGYAEADPANDV